MSIRTAALHKDFSGMRKLLSDEIENSRSNVDTGGNQEVGENR
jgi:hypothetical protein